MAYGSDAPGKVCPKKSVPKNGFTYLAGLSVCENPVEITAALNTKIKMIDRSDIDFIMKNFDSL
jgi:hypothetical protein